MTDAPKSRTKSVKKIKKFFQEDGSLKARADSLIEYFEASDDGGRLIFIEENHPSVMALLRDYFKHKCTKLRGARH
jgi:hypothetical protein